MYRTRTNILLQICLTACILAGLLFPAHVSVQAAAVLAIEPVTWNVIGLDSNNVNTGPDNFPVGVKVCNTGNETATGVTTALTWQSSNPYIDLRSGSLGTSGNPQPAVNLAAGACTNFYYDILVQRTPSAYNTTRRYQVTATASNAGPASTPAPRELFVEKLISQNRNTITDILWKPASALAFVSSLAQPMNLMVGSTYDIQLVGSTATQGYNQLESYINLSNTIFQINSVTTNYTASSEAYDANKLYADACGWNNNPLSPTYRSCIVSDNKSGGGVTNTYNVTILSGGGTSVTLNSLVYDFSGSSYHYNADYSTQARVATISYPVTFGKAFSPSSVTPGTVSTLTFTLTNLASDPAAGVNFTDPLPAGLVVANPPAASTTCAAAVFSPGAGATSLSFTGNVPAGGACTAQVNVVAAAANTYRNTTNTLKIGTLDTGQTASANLIAATQTNNVSCGAGAVLAQWTVPSGSANPPDASGGVPAAGNLHPNVATATVRAASPSSSSIAYAGQWLTYGYAGASQFIEFAIDTRNFTGVQMIFDVAKGGNPGPTTATVSYSTNGSTWTTQAPAITLSETVTTISRNFTGLTSTSGITYFRLTGSGANNNNQGADLVLDNMRFTGTGCAQPPSLSKAFTPAVIGAGSTTTLRLTLTNPNTTPLSGLAFSDPLPTGVTASAGSQAVCGGTLTRTANTLTFSGGTLSASSSCVIDVPVTGVTPGVHTNVTGLLSSTQSGTVTGPGGTATANLTVLVAPGFRKAFSPEQVVLGSSSTLTFTLSNPNSTPISGAAFTDDLPSGMTVANPPAASNTCGAGFAPTAGATSLSFSGGTIPAFGTCTAQVNVNTLSTGTFNNTSSPMTTAISGLTAPAAADTLDVIHHYPGLRLTKQVAASAGGPWSTFLRTTPGTIVYYRLTVENTGDVELTGMYVSDPTLDLGSCTLRTPASLPVGTERSCVLSTTALSGAVQNTASAVGMYGGSAYTSSTSAEYVAAAVLAAPQISLVKQVGTSNLGPWVTSLTNLTAGSSVYYRFTILNTGNTAVSGLSINDPLAAGVSSCEFISPLETGSATVCVVGPLPAAAGTVVNTATASASSHSLTSAPASATYTTGTFTISGVTWQDDDKMADVDPLELPLFNTRLALYRDTNNNGSLDGGDLFLGYQYTDASGAYAFSNLPAGRYFVLAPGAINTRPLVGGMTNPLVVEITSADVTGRNFGYEPPTPNAVTIYDFMAGPGDGGVLVLWATASEVNNLGFYLYRRPAAGGDFELLNADIIPSRSPGQLEGAQYEWLDANADLQGQYVYRLEALDIDGTRQTFETTYQPAVQPVDRPFKVALPLICTK